MTETTLQTPEDIKLYELELKSRAFDIMCELETLQAHSTRLVSEKTSVIQELQKLQQFVKQNKSQERPPTEHVDIPTPIPDIQKPKKSSILTANPNIVNQAPQIGSKKVGRQSIKKLNRS